MKNTICEACGIVYDGELFYPKVGKAWDPSTAYSLVCQYNKSGEACLNKCNEVNPKSDSWAKRAKPYV